MRNDLFVVNGFDLIDRLMHQLHIAERFQAVRHFLKNNRPEVRAILGLNDTFQFITTLRHNKKAIMSSVIIPLGVLLDDYIDKRSKLPVLVLEGIDISKDATSADLNLIFDAIRFTNDRKVLATNATGHCKYEGSEFVAATADEYDSVASSYLYGVMDSEGDAAIVREDDYHILTSAQQA